MFKNMSVRLRIGLGFGIALALILVMALLSIFSLRSINSGFSHLTDTVLLADDSIRDSQLHTNYGARVLREMALNPDTSTYPGYVAQIDDSVKQIQVNVDMLKKTYTENDGLIEKYETALANWIEIKDRAQAALQAGKVDEARTIILEECAPKLEELDRVAIELGKSTDALKQHTLDQNLQLTDTFTKVVIIAVIIIFIAGFLMIIFITRSIVNPLKEVSAVAKEMSKGNLHSTLTFESRDELGQLAHDIRNSQETLASYISDIGRIMHAMAMGDFTIQFNHKFIGDFENIETSIKAFSKEMSNTLSQMGTASEQVSAGAVQVANGAQALSQGTMQQAASVEELSATITTIADNGKENATNAHNANQQVEQMGTDLSQSQQKMGEMINAMNNISATSHEIGKIIKTIEDIAFQTNILALNAAVEAARAGAAGQGFAVVADEVRNLASKSAEASKNSTALIEQSIQAVENGSSIADQTAGVLNSVVEGSQDIIHNITKITEASESQADAVEQVRIGMDQISEVVQTNSATSQESAAASEELSGQAQIMKELVEHFKLPNTDVYHPLAQQVANELPPAADPDIYIPEDDPY